MARRQRTAGGQQSGELRVRMYRVGFGDFFLLTVPSPAVIEVPGPLQMVNWAAVSASRTTNGFLPCRISMRAVSLLADAMADITSSDAAKQAILMRPILTPQCDFNHQRR